MCLCYKLAVQDIFFQGLFWGNINFVVSKTQTSDSVSKIYYAFGYIFTPWNEWWWIYYFTALYTVNVRKKKFVPQLSLSHYILLPAHESYKPWGSRSETDRQTISGNSWENIRQRNLKWSSCSGLQCSNTNETRFLLASLMSATTPRCLLSLAFTHTVLFNCMVYVHISWSWKILIVLSDLKTVPLLYKLIYRKNSDYFIQYRNISKFERTIEITGGTPYHYSRLRHYLTKLVPLEVHFTLFPSAILHQDQRLRIGSSRTATHAITRGAHTNIVILKYVRRCSGNVIFK